MSPSQGFFNVQNMIRRILLILVVLAVPAGLAGASQALADKANPPIPHHEPIVVQLSLAPAPNAAKAQEQDGVNHD
ncbi:hypothetical protein [Glutamicibacter mysorens]|uniref:hypothetical protein n=1 Tax=Glutamicibacter mysorens TaxID=257984 RepID=UPI0012EECF8F|nr:hypothetical protein [Glutamicibacter mysorens]